MNKGFIEIGSIKAKASTEAIRKLKSILDQHGIFHIFDGVMFYDLHAKAVRMEKIHQGRGKAVNKTKDGFRSYKIRHSNRYKYRELIVPDLYELNFISLMFFDFDEAEFLATLIYGDN